jgi:hypothetical protein
VMKHLIKLRIDVSRKYGWSWHPDFLNTSPCTPWNSLYEKSEMKVINCGRKMYLIDVMGNDGFSTMTVSVYYPLILPAPPSPFLPELYTTLLYDCLQRV